MKAMMEGRLIRARRGGSRRGESLIVREDDAVDSVGFDFAIVRLGAGERREERHDKESVWILLGGEATLTFAGEAHHVHRASLFDELPTALSLCAKTALTIDSRDESEWAVVRAANERAFAPRLFLPEALAPERRGQGLAQEMCVRDVRLVFDWNERPESKLVVGEVVSYPGRWSSYPPHHHAQPELYHYRFTEPQGYGHAELDEHVVKVGPGDTLKIMGGETHAQVSAPGYGMYYLWIVKHLPDRPYRGFEFTPEHRWLLDPKNQGWRPAHGDG
jgi:5-deoxy-glucuronate isomerase